MTSWETQNCPPFLPISKEVELGRGGLKPRKNDSQLGGGGELSGMATSQAWGVGQGRKKQLPSAVFSPRCSRGNTDGSSKENTMAAGVCVGGGGEELQGLHVVCVSGRLDSVSRVVLTPRLTPVPGGQEQEVGEGSHA